MKLYIVRHGETKWNREHILQGQLDSPLTEKGIGGAKKIKKSIENIAFAKVYTSQQKRAIATTEIILEDRNNKNYTIDTNITEMSYGSWQGKSQEEICKDPESTQMYMNYFKYPEKYIPVSGGETFEEIMKRAEIFLSKLKEEHDENDVIIAVTHGTFIKAMFTMVKNKGLEEFWDKPNITNCSISILEISKDGIEITHEADDSHLGEHALAITETDYIK
ncbi:MAG: histidine phosphatase family protein [Proteocatella sp.]